MVGKLFLTFVISMICVEVFAFNLIGEKPLTILVSEQEDQVVHTATDIFSSDMELVSGIKPILSHNPQSCNVLVGTIGRNEFIEELIHAGKINVDKIKGDWEAFQIQVIEFDGSKLLVVIGSDKRGTAYGILELSRLIGVSPWVWWADSKPQKKTKLILPDDYFNSQQPSVQYRGIFINDESEGLTPWSTQTYDQSNNKSVGTKTYSKIFELLLRLRANTIWPAMHPKSKPFYYTEGNKETAAKYGIIVGTSHHEPLMRNTSEWDSQKLGDYNYLTNKKNILNFWNERVEQLKGYENFYTLGIRGLGDKGMIGASSIPEQVEALNSVIKDQREILGKYINSDVTTIPQVFVPYKEVLEIYNNGLNVPDDITLMWCDDNYGYITRFNEEKERNRKGGSGIYYHVSYWGRPHEYTWLSSSSPALTYWQLKKSYDTGNRKLWIVNVGDIKPAELDLEYFLNLAWGINNLDETNFQAIFEKTLAREFGDNLAPILLQVTNEYYRLAFIRKPELMGWSRQDEDKFPNRLSPVIDTEFNPYVCGDQIYKRLKDYDAIMQKADEILMKLPEDKKDEFYQLIYFPVHASGEMNRKLLYAQKARLYAGYNLPVANEYAKKSLEAYSAVDTLVNFYNLKMSGGKWNHMMHSTAWKQPVYREPSLPDIVQLASNDEVLILPENYTAPIVGQKVFKLPPFVNPTGKETFISIFTYNDKKLSYMVKKSPQWLGIKEDHLSVTGENRLIFFLKPEKLQEKEEKGQVIIAINNIEYTFEVSVDDFSKIGNSGSVEYNKMVVLDVSNYESKGLLPVTYKGLGYSQKSIEIKPGAENAVSYKVFTSSYGNVNLTVRLLPVHPINNRDIRYVISVDNEKPQVVSYKTDYIGRSDEWKDNVSRNQAVKTTKHILSNPGTHSIKIYALDEGVVLDQIALDFELGRHFYEIPSKIDY